MADDKMSRLKEIQSDLESFQTGVGRFEMGMPGGWHYPMMYKSDDVPPVLEKQKMLEALTGVRPSTHVEITDEDRSMIKRKQDTIDEASFDAWLLDQYRPWEHPAFKAYFLQKYPHFQDKMEAAIKKKADFQLRAQIEALKDTPEGDMFRFQMTQHPEMQAMLAEPLGPEHNREMATSANVQDNPDFQRGLLNPFKLQRSQKLAGIGRLVANAGPEVTAPGVMDSQYGYGTWGQNISHFPTSGGAAIIQPQQFGQYTAATGVPRTSRAGFPMVTGGFPHAFNTR